MRNKKGQIPILTRKKDFDNFWQRTLMKLENVALDIELKEESYPSEILKVYAISCKSMLNETLNGWYIVPMFNDEVINETPIVVEYPDYLTPIHEPIAYLHWITMGYAVLVLDVRGQGGKTYDHVPYETYSAAEPITRGLLSEGDYYQRRVFADALRTVEVASDLHPNAPVILSGSGQGGMMALAAAALGKEQVSLVCAEAPTGSYLLNQIQKEQGMYRHIAEYLRRFPDQIETINEVQTYFDLMNLAEWITCPVYVAVGGKDQWSPSENFAATYERIQTEKEVFYYPFSGHEAGGEKHTRKKMTLIHDFFARPVKNFDPIDEL